MCSSDLTGLPAPYDDDDVSHFYYLSLSLSLSIRPFFSFSRSVDAACSDENFSVLCELLEGDDDLVSLFTDAEGGFTFFAPIDAAFEEVAALFEAATPEEAESILAFHLVLGSITPYEALECTVETEMANGTPSRTKCEREDGLVVGKYQKGGGNRKNNNLPFIILPNNLVCNGIIHAIDAVMLPNKVPEIPGLFD